MGLKDISKELAEVSANYHFHQPPAFIEQWREALQRLARSISEFLRDFFHHSGDNIDSRSVSFLLQLTVYAVGTVAIVIALVLIYRRLRNWQKTTAASVRGAVVVEDLLDADGWREQGKKLAAAADYKGACRALYLSLLQRMDEFGVAKFDPARTNYEYAYWLSKQPIVQRQFKDMAELVEYIWFGNRAAQQDDYEQSLRRLNELDPQLQTIGEQKRNAEAVR